MTGPCARRVVTATLILPDGRRFVGTNDVRRPQRRCPRGDMPSGVGYRLCAEVCDQTGHAESNAIEAAMLETGRTIRGSVLYLEGHDHACGPCQAIMDWAGVKMIIGAPPTKR